MSGEMSQRLSEKMMCVGPTALVCPAIPDSAPGVPASAGSGHTPADAGTPAPGPSPHDQPVSDSLSQEAVLDPLVGECYEVVPKMSEDEFVFSSSPQIMLSYPYTNPPAGHTRQNYATTTTTSMHVSCVSRGHSTCRAVHVAMGHRCVSAVKRNLVVVLDREE